MEQYLASMPSETNKWIPVWKFLERAGTGDFVTNSRETDQLFFDRTIFPPENTRARIGKKQRVNLTDQLSLTLGSW